MIKQNVLWAAMAAGLVMAQGASAAVTAEEAAKLKSSLTPLGAEKAGNKDGSIPAWDGGITPSPSQPESRWVTFPARSLPMKSLSSR